MEPDNDSQNVTEQTPIAKYEEPQILEVIEIEDLTVDGICGVY